MDHVRATESKLSKVERDYAGDEDRPLGAYAGLLATYGSVVAALVAVARSRRVRLPERMPAADLALLAVGTFRASRLITKDSVTAVARSPFTRYEGPAAPGEVQEEVVGTGARHAVGELISCPFCLSVWLATAGTFGMLTFPRATRLVCGTLTAVTASDGLQFAFSALDRAVEK